MFALLLGHWQVEFQIECNSSEMFGSLAMMKTSYKEKE